MEPLDWSDEEGVFSDEAYDRLLEQVFISVSSHQNELDAVALITAAGLGEGTSPVGTMLSVLNGADGAIANPGRLLALSVLLARYSNFLMQLIAHNDGQHDQSVYDQLLAMLLDDAPERNAEWLATNGGSA